MKKFLTFILLSTFISVVHALEVRGLEDLPSQWAGRAGDIFNSTQGNLSISNSQLTKREEFTGFVVLTYSTQSELRIGTRSLPIAEIILSSYKSSPKTVEITLKTTDELTGNLFTIVVIPEDEDGVFKMKENSLKGFAHRFVLDGKLESTESPLY